jgi:hypothetical protein
MCTRRCRDVRALVPAGEVPAAYTEKLDPAVALEQLAAQLAAAYAADPSNATLARELRATLLVLRPAADTGVLDELAILGKYLRTPTAADGTDPYDFG